MKCQGGGQEKLYGIKKRLRSLILSCLTCSFFFAAWKLNNLNLSFFFEGVEAGELYVEGDDVEGEWGLG